jgi:hypothetical protein
MIQNFHAVGQSVVERQGLAVAVGAAGFVGAAAVGVVVVVEVAGVEAAVAGKIQLDKITQINNYSFGEPEPIMSKLLTLPGVLCIGKVGYGGVCL